MTKLVHYTIDDKIATITLDDGKNNLISPAMLEQINSALDKAEEAGAVVILTGAGQVFSAGFDLGVIRSGIGNAFTMLIGGFRLSERMLSFPQPVLIACNGHAVAMGSFLLMSADYRIGTLGDYRIVANEVELGMTMPYAAIEVCKQRLNQRYLGRVINLSEVFNPQSAINAGFLDESVAADKLLERAVAEAERFAELDLNAHHASKLRFRRRMLKDLRKAIRKDKLAFIGMGLNRVFAAGKKS